MQTDQLLQTLNFIRPLSGKLQDRLNESLREEVLPKKHVLQRQGDTCRRIYFIVRGLARAFYTSDSDRECTTLGVARICFSFGAFWSALFAPLKLIS
jgi:CRP/FNR family transcriptional regulator, anaerobic regulatory protein